ncbi:MAG: YraN family protein [Verrucomicrobiota bacterium]|nr:YraN family protein [Verrucomicrobiota bacterium]
MLKDPSETKAIGDFGEEMAAYYLRKYHRYKILARQWEAEHGEIDLLARDRDTLVFVEVKTRASEDFGRAAAAVNAQKRRNLSRAALEYLRRLNKKDIYFRFDIVEVVKVEAPETYECRLIQNAFELSTPYRY